MEDDWLNFCDGAYTTPEDNVSSIPAKKPDQGAISTPIFTDLNISTKTKISYLNQPIDQAATFWKIPICAYHLPEGGIVKKEMKFDSTSQAEVDDILARLKDTNYTVSKIISHIDEIAGRTTYKDTRKISIGISQKDIISSKCKKKNAFYNCFALIIRLVYKSKFREMNVKVFNTGKLEMPGILSDELMDLTIAAVIKVLKPYVGESLELYADNTWNVMINSNFHCGYYINRELLYHRLMYLYHIHSSYDSCSYPGIKCKFYYNLNTVEQDGRQPPSTLSSKELKSYIKVSCMIFRTGSILIVGKCTEEILYSIHKFIKNLLMEEFPVVGGELCDPPAVKITKNKKIRKTILVFD